MADQFHTYQLYNVGKQMPYAQIVWFKPVNMFLNQYEIHDSIKPVHGLAKTP
jgi:hypothetical protein